MSTEISHGRGGAGNISVDDTKYVDGEVVRTGAEGSHGDGAYSAGRGGAGNIGDVGITTTDRKDQDVVPEAAVRPSSDDRDFHTGRGGAGNEQKAKLEEDKAVTAGPVYTSLADKIKHKLLGSFKK